jgi:hypothetical protein
MADTDKLVKVGQLDTIVDEIVDKFGETNGRFNSASGNHRRPHHAPVRSRSTPQHSERGRG